MGVKWTKDIRDERQFQAVRMISELPVASLSDADKQLLISEAVTNKLEIGLLVGLDRPQFINQCNDLIRRIKQPPGTVDTEAIVKAIIAADQRKKARLEQSDKSYTSMGTTLRVTLGLLYETHPVLGNGAQFLSVQEQAQAAADLLGGNESDLIAFMAPHFTAKLLPLLISSPGGTQCVLVNSERYPWVPQGTGVLNQYLAPGQFVCPSYLVRFRLPYANAPNQGNQDYGSLSDYQTKSSIRCVYDGKAQVGDHEVGEFSIYMEMLTHGTIGVLTGMVYDSTHGVLMEARQGDVVRAADVQWTAIGSLAYIQSFLADPLPIDIWDVALRAALVGLNVALDPPAPSTAALQQIQPGVNNLGNVLGAGRSGRVFRVAFQGRVVAMKVVHGDNCRNLTDEFNLIGALPAGVVGSFVAVEQNSLWTGYVQAPQSANYPVCAYLLVSVGLPFRHREEVTNAHGPLILQSLSNLHAANVIHGDARYRNVVRVTNAAGVVEYRWIDFQARNVASPGRVGAEIRLFFSTLGRVCDDIVIDAYATDVCNGTLIDQQRLNAATNLWTISH